MTVPGQGPTSTTAAGTPPARHFICAAAAAARMASCLCRFARWWRNAGLPPAVWSPDEASAANRATVIALNLIHAQAADSARRPVADAVTSLSSWLRYQYDECGPAGDIDAIDLRRMADDLDAWVRAVVHDPDRAA